MWPVFTSFWNQIVLGQPVLQPSTSINQEPAGSIGLTSDFYNKTCLPLFAILMTLLSLCPWLGWTRGIHNTKNITLVLITFFYFFIHNVSIRILVTYRHSRSFICLCNHDKYYITCIRQTDTFK